LAVGLNGYGRHKELLCPMFDSTKLNCKIWQNRPIECASFFCIGEHSVRESETAELLSKRLNLLESALAQEAMIERGFNNSEIEACLERIQLDPEYLKSNTGSKLDMDLWCHHTTRKESYFIECFEHIDNFPEEKALTLFE